MTMFAGWQVGITRSTLRLLLAIALASWTASEVAAQSDNLSFERGLTAKIRVAHTSGINETAAAIYVGKDGKSAYFVTAYHALQLKTGTPMVTLQLPNEPQSHSATAFEKYDASMDLGVVTVPLSELNWESSPQSRKRDAKADMKIRIFGHPSDNGWSLWSGTVQNEIAPGSDPRHFTTSRDQSLTDGYSGGPVFDDAGELIGMHTSTQLKYGISLKIGDILRQLHAWGVPTNGILEELESSCAGSSRFGGHTGIAITQPARAGVGGSDEVDLISGDVCVDKISMYRVTIYTFAGGQWWVQPTIANPLTNISGDGRWESVIHLGGAYAALLVRPSYQAPPRLDNIPAVGGDIIAIAQSRPAH